MRLPSYLLVISWVFCALAAADTGPPEADNPEAPQAVLKQRVTAKWEALVRKDFPAAYALTSPAYRQIYSLDAFRSGFGAKTAWQRIEVVDVALKGDDAALVGINLHFMYYPPQSEQALDMKTYVQEPWVRVDGKWWYLVRE